MTYRHDSPRAAATLANLPPGGKLHELALPRSERNPNVSARAEMMARAAAARLCQRDRLRLLDVWFEDGMHDDFGMYRLYFITTAPEN